MRKSHGDELLQGYYRSSSEFLVQLGCEPEHLFPFSALENQLSKYSLFNLGMAFILPYWLDQGDGSDGYLVVGDGGDSSAGAALMKGPYCRMSDECFQRIVDVIEESVDFGYVV
jgi:hypothetical protein